MDSKFGLFDIVMGEIIIRLYKKYRHFVIGSCDQELANEWADCTGKKTAMYQFPVQQPDM